MGPLSLEELIRSNIDSDTLVWKTGMEDWKPAKCFPELHSYIDIIKETEEHLSTQVKQVKPINDQLLNDGAEDIKDTL